MTLNELKTYLSGRIGTSKLLALADTELTKYMNTSQLLLNTYFNFSDISLLDQQVAVVAQEMLFLFNSNIDLNLFYEYNGLQSFNIGGAVQGTVAYNQVGSLFGRIVKGLLQANGITQKVQDADADLFTSFARV